MDKLWKKELVNLFHSGIHEENFIISLKHSLRGVEVNEQSKNNEISSNFRDEGNKMFKKKQWQDAMEYYNLSLRFAELETDNMSITYANRSACFFYMQKYDKCLVDIDLAKNANYPMEQMHKLTEREIKCMEKLKETPNESEMESKYELSYKPNKHFPGMANVLKVQYNDEYGRHIIASKNIDVGKTVLVEDAFLFGEHKGNNYNFCDTCAKYETNFIPCPDCVSVLFCNEDCMRNNITHELECGATCVKNIIAQSILLAISTFDNNIEDLMEFVGNVLTDNALNLPIKSTDSQLKYGYFLKLMALPKMNNKDEPLQLYQNLMSRDKFKDLFNTEEKQRFLMHLLWQHIMILYTNMMLVDSEYTPIKLSKVHIITSLFNHSCLPNVIIKNDLMKIIAITIRPMKKGEQLFISYERDSMMMETISRQAYLENNYQFKCKCSKCLPCADFQTKEFILDPKYQKILKKSLPLEFSDENERIYYKNTCCEYLNEFGHLPWSELLEHFMIRFIECL